MYCAIKAAKDFGLKEGQRCVVILPDSIRNYMYVLQFYYVNQRAFLCKKHVTVAGYYM